MRQFAPARSSFAAIQERYDLKNVLYQRALVEQFVQAAATSKKGGAIIQGMADLAHHCKMLVVAEGIEDAMVNSALDHVSAILGE